MLKVEETPGEVKENIKSGNSNKIFNYGEKKKRTESKLAAYAAKVTKRAKNTVRSSDIQDRETNEPGQRLDFNTLQKFNNLGDIRDSFSRGAKEEFDDKKQSTLDNSNLIGFGEISKSRDNEYEDASSLNNDDEQYKLIIEKHFGLNLIQYFEKYFIKTMKNKEYVCDSKK